MCRDVGRNNVKRVVNGQDYVVVGLGARFVEPQPADLAALYAESDPLAPIIFVLSTGTDPAAGNHLIYTTLHYMITHYTIL